ncbi:hypothetical protein BJV77DRAFT_621137 [Russula vinacea]|nr:hypothetical protein BJV77DRAFT_621137 [Russula vinacea]
MYLTCTSCSCGTWAVGRLLVNSPFVSLLHEPSCPVSPPHPPHSNFVSIFNAALETYKRATKKDLASHPLLPSLQYCDSPEAILTALREQIPALSQSQNGDDRLTKWVTPAVNVLYSFSATLTSGGAAGLAFPPANTIFAGIGVLLLVCVLHGFHCVAYFDTHGSQAVKDARASQNKLIDLFNHIERFFRRLEIYTRITPTTAMTDMVIEIMVEVLAILAIATREAKCGRLKKYMKKLIGNTEVEDSLSRLDKLTQEEARMASAELLKITRSVDGKVMDVDDRVKDVDKKVQDVCGDVQDVGGNVQDVGNKVQGVGDRVQGIGSDVKDISSEVRGVDDKLDQVNRNLLRDSLLRWLSPPDPSINHNIASKAQHSGTARWFL